MWMRCSECSNFMDKLNRCKFCHFERSNSSYSDRIQSGIRRNIISEQNKVINELKEENMLLKILLRELL